VRAVVAEGRNREGAEHDPPDVGVRRRPAAPAQGRGTAGPQTGGARIVAFGTLPPSAGPARAPGPGPRSASPRPTPPRSTPPPAFDPADMATEPPPDGHHPRPRRPSPEAPALSPAPRRQASDPRAADPRQQSSGQPGRGAGPSHTRAVASKQTFRAVAFGNPTAGGAEVIAGDPDAGVVPQGGSRPDAPAGTGPWVPSPLVQDPYPGSDRFTDDPGLPASARSAPAAFRGDGSPARGGFTDGDGADPRAFRKGAPEPDGAPSPEWLSPERLAPQRRASERHSPPRPEDRPGRVVLSPSRPEPHPGSARGVAASPLERVSTTGVRPPLPGDGPPRPGGGRRQPASAALNEVSFTGRLPAVREDDPPPRNADAGRTDSGGLGRSGRSGRGPRPRLLTVLQVVVVIAVIVVGVSIGRTLALPGDSGVLTRLADWGRANHLSFLVDRVDRSG